MNPLIFLFQVVVYQPLLNLLVIFYGLFHDFGVALLLLTLLVRLLSWPLNSKILKIQQEQQKKLQQFQGKMELIKKKYKHDSQAQTQELLKVVKERKINPFASFLPMAIQVIILIGIWQALRAIIQPQGELLLYGFVFKPETISTTFLGIIDLAKASPILAILVGISQYFYSKIALRFQTSKKKIAPEQKQMAGMQKMMEKQMTYFMPLFTVFIAWALPAGLPLYWLLSNLIGILQQKLFLSRQAQV